ncbi:MAG: hypothetical protein R3279_08565 [Putridiphycobacter sp.]|nr:hypothetical protein [Putridiphycobacter sp.]
MKKLKYGALFLALVGIGFASCEKEKIKVEKNSEVVVSAPQTRTSSGRHVNYNSQGEVIGCSGTGGTCANEVEVVGIMSPAEINTLSTTVSSNNQSDIQTYFDDNENILVQVFGSANVEAVINGYLSVKLDGQVSQSTVGYFIFADAVSSELTAVVPVSE